MTWRCAYHPLNLLIPGVVFLASFSPQQSWTQELKPTVLSSTRSNSNWQQITRRQDQKLSQTLQNTPPPPETNPWGRIWQQVIRRRDQEKPRTGRGLICPVVPQFINQRVIWRDRPIFVWKGQAEKVSVANFNNPQRPIWIHDVSRNENSVVYAGESLKSGNRYIWKAESGGNSSQVIFQILELSSRNKATAKLEQLESQQNQKKVVLEERVRQRIQFFLNQNLFLDAIQELYTLPNPSPELKAIQKQLIQVSCPD